MCLARKNDGEKQSGQEERDRGREIKFRQVQEIPARHFEGNTGMQDNFKHGHNQNGVDEAEAGSKLTRVEAGEKWFQEIGEYAARAESQQRNRNREKCKVVEEHDRKKACEAKLQ